MTRWLTALVAGTVLLTGPVDASAAGCVLADDPAGDAATYPGLPSNPDHDIRRLTADVTGEVIRFRMTLERVPSGDPAPGTGYDWSVWFMTPRSEVQMFVHRTYARDNAGAAHDNGEPAPYDVPFTIDSRTATVTMELPYKKAGLRRGERLTQIRAHAGPFNGIDTAVGDLDHGLYGVSGFVDDAETAKTIAVGDGCR